MISRISSARAPKGYDRSSARPAKPSSTSPRFLLCRTVRLSLALPRIRCDNRRTLRVFSGIQPTGAKHFGNYSGGFRQYAATQELGDAFFCIVDLHSITVDFDPE